MSDPAGAIAHALADAWARHDDAAWIAQFWPDSRFVNVLGHVFDAEENRAQHARIWSGMYKGSHLEIRRIDQRLLGADHALVEMDSAGIGFAALPPGLKAINGALLSHMVLILERRGGAWRIIYAQNTAFTPLPMPPPSAG